MEFAFIEKFCDLCNEGYVRGWHERNGGNLSYRLKEEEVEEIAAYLHEGEYREIGTYVPNLANEYFLVTGSGKFLGNVKRDVKHNICIIHIDATGHKYAICWGLEGGGKPTSELPTHLMNHEVAKLRSNGAQRVVYHCHATNVIALTYILPLEAKTFTRELWESSVECAIVFPQGVGVLPFMVPGGRAIAEATSELIKKYDVVIWSHHGLFATGVDFDSTFGLADTVEKAATILVKVLSMNNNTKRQTLTKADFAALAQEFNVDIDLSFLD